MWQMILDNIYNFFDNIAGTIDALIDFDINLPRNLSPMIFSNSLYDMYYCLSLLITNKKIEGITLGPFQYPNSFYIYIDDTDYYIEVQSYVKDNNYYIYTAIMTDEEAIKIPELGYRNLYKEQSNNESFIEDVILTKEFLLDGLIF